MSEHLDASSSASRDGREEAVLVVYPFCMDHVGHGNIQRTLRLAQHLAAAGFAVDLVYQGNPRFAPVTAQYAAFRRVHRVESVRGSRIEAEWDREVDAFHAGRDLPSRRMRSSAALATLVRALLDAHPYRAVIGVYAWTAPIFASLDARVLRVCDVQDVMHEFADAHRQVTGEATTFSLPADTEEFLWRQWDVLLAITPDDRARIRRAALPHQPVLSVRHAATAIATAPSMGSDDVALYTGSDNASNLRAVRWLLDEVWPLVRAARPAARLTIAGLICRALPEAVRAIPGVELIGFRSDLGEDLAACGVVVAPYLFGSGLKIKVVEAACAGKAIVTTAAGVAGSGLTAGAAVHVHDDAPAFAAALAALLGDRGRRDALASRALAEARDLFSPAACYDPVVSAIRVMSQPRPAVADGVVDAAIVDRVKAAWRHLAPARVILWGNGAHTRALIEQLARLSIPVSLIVDKSAQTPRVSAEGIAAVPPSQLDVRTDDLIVLSSESFEAEMWRDLTPLRDAGACVLGLYDGQHVSRGVRDRLGSDALRELRVPMDAARLASAQPAIALWDPRATIENGSRLAAHRALAAAAAPLGRRTVLFTARQDHASTAALEAALPSLTVAPLIEWDARAIRRGDPDGGLGALVRLIDRMTHAAARVLTSTALAHDDLLVLVRPSVTDCFVLARVLRAYASDVRPRVAMWNAASADATAGEADQAEEAAWLGITLADLRSYGRLAIAELREAADGDLAIAGHDDGGAHRGARADAEAVLRHVLHQTEVRA